MSIGIIGLFIFIPLLMLIGDGIATLKHQVTRLILFIYLIICFIGGWVVGGSFDEQSIELEAILKKLGFNKPSMANLNDFSVFSMNIKNKIKRDEYPDRWEQYTYRLDLAKQYDEEKYGKK
ncbi:hypothetical protein ACDX34_00230 [Acinetobacter bereziniae]